VQKPSKPQLLVLAIIVALVFGGGMQLGRYRQNHELAQANLLAVIDDAAAPLSELPVEPETPPAEPPPLIVHVKGAVEKPGVYELPPGSRVADALDKAVLLPEANTDIINLALPLSDSAEVVAPFRVEGEETDWEVLAASAAVAPAGGGDGSASGNNSEAASALININGASLTALQALSGIGPVKAQAIIDYREQHGPFKKIDDIKNVSGIGPATYDKIKDHLSVE
jgi:competence protein ComEA